MKRLILFLVSVVVIYSQTLSNVWNPSWNGQKWKLWTFRDIAVNRNGGIYDGYVYITSSGVDANHKGILVYSKAAWQSSSFPDTAPTYKIGLVRLAGTNWATGPYGISISADDKIYISDYSNKKITVCDPDGNNASILKQTNGSTELTLTYNPRHIRVVGSGTNTVIYYGQGLAAGASTGQKIMKIYQSGSGWAEQEVFTTVTQNLAVQTVVKHPIADTIWVTYASSPFVEKYYYNGTSWVKDNGFTISGTSSSYGGNFMPAVPSYLIFADGSVKAFRLLHSGKGVQKSAVNYGYNYSSAGYAGGGSDYYDMSTIFVVGYRQSSSVPADTASFFEKITSSTPLPVEFQSINAKVVNGAINITWQTAMERDVKEFVVEKKIADKWDEIGFVVAKGNTNLTSTYNFVDNSKNYGLIKYRIKSVDLDGSVKYSDEVEVNAGIAKTIELIQNYPNPFNPATNIYYTLPEKSTISIKIYDIKGSLIATLFEGEKEAGNHIITYNANNLPTGTYICKLQSGNTVKTIKMLLMK